MKTRLAHFPVRFFLLSALVVFAAACAGPGTPKPHKLQLEIKATADVNPDIDNRPSPVILHVLELSAVDEFLKADFFALTSDDASALGGDVLNKTELILTPGSSKSMSLDLKPDTSYVGFVAGYRDIDNARWRVAEEVARGESSQMNVEIGNKQITVN